MSLSFPRRAIFRPPVCDHARADVPIGVMARDQNPVSIPSESAFAKNSWNYSFGCREDRVTPRRQTSNGRQHGQARNPIGCCPPPALASRRGKRLCPALRKAERWHFPLCLLHDELEDGGRGSDTRGLHFSAERRTKISGGAGRCRRLCIRNCA